MTTRSDEFYRWIEDHAADDPLKMRLKYASAGDGFDYDAAITQIECRKQFGKKLADTLSRAPHFYFPNRLSGEQSTSDRLADYHKTLVMKDEPLIDLTSGLGIDVFHCSAECSRTVAVERSSEVAEALRTNAEELRFKNIKIVCDDCRDVIYHTDGEMFGTAFIDPARRDKNGGRVFRLSDCEPDVTLMLPKLSEICRRLIVKMSPMLDISHTINALGGCSEIIALGTSTECKELIAVKDFCDSNQAGNTLIKGMTLLSDRCVEFTFTKEEEAGAPAPAYTLPEKGNYLYEPFPSMMKLGANRLMAFRYGLDAFLPNCRLYHSSAEEDNFPGEMFEIKEMLDYSSRNIKRFKKDYPQINVATRNFGMSAETLRSKLGVREGGRKRVFGIIGYNDRRFLIVAEPVKGS